MLLCLDESEPGTTHVLGGLLVPLKVFSELEKKIIEFRVKNKLFGELKWSKVTPKYFDKYKDFSDIFFDSKDVTFHSICYRPVVANAKAKAAYVLVRTLTWKINNAHLGDNLFILFDSDGEPSKHLLKDVREYAAKDPRFKCKINFCHDVISHCYGIMQLADVILGSVSTSVNKDAKRNVAKTDLLEYLVKRNNNIPLDYRLESFPQLYQQKIHFFDPNDYIHVNH